jgi:hypothetical protein
MDKKMMIMAIVAAMSIIASGYGVSFAADPSQPPGVQGLWSMGQQECKIDSGATQPQTGTDWMLYPSQTPGVEGLALGEHRYGVNLTEPERGMDYLDQSSQPSGVQGLWPTNAQTKC